MRVLLIDDDIKLCDMMAEFFSQSGRDLYAAHDGRGGLARLWEIQPDIVLLDIMLPALNGFSVLQQIKRSAPTPVIMLSARSHRDDRIAGLTRGADDYVTKPFDPDELLARIEAVLRRVRTQPSARSVRELGHARIDTAARVVWLHEQRLDLTTLEFDILERLTRQPGRLVSREELSRLVLGRPLSASDRALDVHVSHLRKKLGSPVLIQTRRGLGYAVATEGDP